jgi:hypothetical protein
MRDSGPQTHAHGARFLPLCGPQTIREKIFRRPLAKNFNSVYNPE